MGKYLLAIGNIAKLNEFTQSEVFQLTTLTVDEIALATLKGQARFGITIVSSQRKFIFDISVLSIFTKLIDKMLQTGI